MQRENSASGPDFSAMDWSPHAVGIVVSDFNADITGNLLKGAMDFLLKVGFKQEQVTVVHVPGSYEIPLMCQKLARTKKFTGLVAIGAVIKGATDHYYHISNEASRGIMQVMLEESLPIAFGVITTSNLEQAQERSGTKDNKGEEAVKALLVMMQNLA